MSKGVAFYDQGHRTPSKKQVEASNHLNQEQFDTMVVGRYLCQYHNVRDLHFIDPFAKYRVNAWEVMTENMLGAELKDVLHFHVDPTKHDPESQVRGIALGETQKCQLLTNPQPKNPFKHPNTQEPMPSDLDQVCIYSISCRRYASDLPISVAPRLNYYPRAMSELQDMKQRDEIVKAAKGIRGAFTQFKPTGGKDQDLNSVPMPELTFAYQNRFFVRTWAHVNETNIRNGLVPIPPEVCAQARLPLANTSKIEVPEELVLEQFKLAKIADRNSPEAQKMRQEMNDRYRQEIMEMYPDAKPIEFYYAVPINHVLAWGYTSEDYLSERKHKAYQFRFTPPRDATRGDNTMPVVLYFIVPNTLVEANIESALQHMVGKADKQNIQNVGFEFLPNPMPEEMPPTPSDCQGTLKMRAYISYYSGPKLAPGTIANLAPTLCPGYPPPHQWSSEEQAKMAAIQQYQHETGKAVSGFKK